MKPTTNFASSLKKYSMSKLAMFTRLITNPKLNAGENSNIFCSLTVDEAFYIDTLDTLFQTC